MKTPFVLALLMLVSSPAMARKDCNELKSEIEAKVKANGVKSFTLDIVSGDAKDGKVAAAEAKGGKVVGSCDGGTKKIVFTRG